VDKRGITIFAGVMAGATLAVQAFYSFPILLGSVGLQVPGFPFTLPLLWLPALAAFLGAGLSGDDAVPRLRVWPVPWKPVLALALGIPLAFAAVGVLCMTADWVKLDRGMLTFVMELPPSLGASKWSAGQLTALFWFALILSTVLGPTLFALLWLGAEIGWRDYLLPKLLPLGRVPAYAITGAVWGLWMAWLGLFSGEEQGAFPLLRCVVWGMVVGTFLAEIWRRGRSVGLAAIAFGAYSAQALGIWPHVFVGKQAPAWCGPNGWISIAVWAVIAAVLFIWPEEKPEK
jgi:hypothetical protein